MSAHDIDLSARLEAAETQRDMLVAALRKIALDGSFVGTGGMVENHSAAIARAALRSLPEEQA